MRDDGSRVVSLARFGAYEVRLIELAQKGSGDLPPLWLELYSHHVQWGIDSCSAISFEEAVIAAEALISQARRLNKRSPVVN